MIEALKRRLLRKDVVRQIWRRSEFGSFAQRIEYDAIGRPHYGFCAYGAALLGVRLGLERISVAEFGVAGGRGLIELERCAAAIERELPIKISVYGFDTGAGLPAPVDYRDLPYVWQAGHFRMDVDLLRSKLRNGTSLVLGDVKETVPSFFETWDAPPLGAAFLDLDYWSSTLDAMEIFKAPPERLLPRIFCYFDDVFSIAGEAVQCEDVGQLRAIGDYNAVSPTRKMRQMAGLAQTRQVRASWPDKIYVHHIFDHPSYNSYVFSERDRQLAV
jgi:hypothetical protein